MCLPRPRSFPCVDQTQLVSQPGSLRLGFDPRAPANFFRRRRLSPHRTSHAVHRWNRSANNQETDLQPATDFGAQHEIRFLPRLAEFPRPVPCVAAPGSEGDQQSPFAKRETPGRELSLLRCGCSLRKSPSVFPNQSRPEFRVVTLDRSLRSLDRT